MRQVFQGTAKVAAKVAAMACVIAGCTVALAQSDYPNHAVKLIVPNVPGGATDIVGRFVGQKLSEIWGQPVVIDNRGAVNGIVGAELGSKAPPDGYTLTVGNSGTHVMNYGFYKKLPYDPVNGFTPIARLAFSPSVLMVNAALPVTNTRELIAYAKTRQMNMASAGATGNFASLLLRQMTGMDLLIVPYKGSAPSDLSVISGETQLAFTSLAGAKVHMQGGKVRLLAVTSLTREPSLPNVPTLDESGVKGYEVEFWAGLFAPPGTPKAIVDKINADVGRVLALPETQKKMVEMGLSADYVPTTPFATSVKASVEKYSRLMRELGVEQE